MIKKLNIEQGSFEFALPLSFLPQYNKHEVMLGVNEKIDISLVPKYSFQYGFDVISSKKITFISSPEGTKTVATAKGYRIEMPLCDKIPRRELKFFYRTEDMLFP